MYLYIIKFILFKLIYRYHKFITFMSLIDEKLELLLNYPLIFLKMQFLRILTYQIE